MNKKYKNILIIGGSGFIGSHTADILSKNGHNVTILDKTSSPWLKNDQNMIVGDITDNDTLDASMKDIDCVYYFAGIADIDEAKSDPYQTIDINILALTKTLESSIKNKVRNFVYASTMYVYSVHGSFYRASKQAAEIIIETYSENYGMNYVFLRYGSLYGPRSQIWNGIKGFAIQIIKNGYLEYPGDGTEIREYIHVIDAAKLSVKALEKEYMNSAITITGQQSIKVSDMFAMMFEIVGKKIDIKYKKKDGVSHYGKTPYRYTPKTSIKIIPTEFVDLGQGLLDIVEEIYQQDK